MTTAPSITDSPVVTRPGRTAARAAVFTTDPALADRVAALHPAVRVAVLTRLTPPGADRPANGGAGPQLRDGDALLIIRTTTTTRSIYLAAATATATDAVAARAVALHATGWVDVTSPAGDAELRRLLTQRLDGAP